MAQELMGVSLSGEISAAWKTSPGITPHLLCCGSGTRQGWKNNMSSEQLIIIQSYSLIDSDDMGSVGSVFLDERLFLDVTEPEMFRKETLHTKCLCLYVKEREIKERERAKHRHMESIWPQVKSMLLKVETTLSGTVPSLVHSRCVLSCPGCSACVSGSVWRPFSCARPPSMTPSSSTMWHGPDASPSTW